MSHTTYLHNNKINLNIRLQLGSSIKVYNFTKVKKTTSNHTLTYYSFYGLPAQ